MFKFWNRHLYPLDMLYAAIYSVVIVMMSTLNVHFLLSGLYALPHQVDEQGLLLTAITAAITWALVDSVMYVLTAVAERDESGRYLRSIRNAPSRRHAVDEVAALLEERLDDVTGSEMRAQLATSIVNQFMHREPQAAGIMRADLAAACALFTVTVMSVVPMIAPLVFVRPSLLALRLSNGAAILSLFAYGYLWARFAGSRPLRSGLIIALVGTVLAVIAVFFGG